MVTRKTKRIFLEAFGEIFIIMGAIILAKEVSSDNSNLLGAAYTFSFIAVGIAIRIIGEEFK